MELGIIHDVTTWLLGHSHGLGVSQLFHLDLSIFHGQADLVAQFKQTDLAGDVQRWFNGLIRTGQLWAFLIGLIVGYLFRSLTTYG
ncbi:MAG: hypothetical protein ACKO24_16335 [Leptolyngbyaceae cyanobacterium]